MFLSIPVDLTADDAAELCDDVFDADHASGAVLALRQQVAVHLVDDVADRFFSDLEVVRLRAVASRIHDRRHVDAASLADEPPDEARNERQHRLPHTSAHHQHHHHIIRVHTFLLTNIQDFSRTPMRIFPGPFRSQR